MASGKRKISYFIFVIILALLVVSFFYRLPYEVMKPGDAHDLGPVIHIKGGHKYKNGKFMFMTVRLVQPNIYQYLIAKAMKYETVIPMGQLLQKGQSMQEYQRYQIQLMDSAQYSAIYMAYDRAGKHPKIEHNGVIVVGLIKGMPASKKLKPGDIIVGADGKSVKTNNDLLQIVKSKKPGQSIPLTIKRKGKSEHVSVAVGHFPKQVITSEKKQGIKPKKYGIGINLTENVKLKVHPQVHFDTGQIGGPSGGLLFTLAIYNRLTSENWTKGYKIAGTGTMNIEKVKGSNQYKGVVGPIGGIKDKVVAADRRNVEIFFAPVADNNYKNAVAAAKDIHTKMKIVPVKTFKDALDYLKKLKPKPGYQTESTKKAS